MYTNSFYPVTLTLEFALLFENFNFQLLNNQSEIFGGNTIFGNRYMEFELIDGYER